MSELQSRQSADVRADNRADNNVETRDKLTAPCRLIFVSYSREDGSEFAKELADWLESNGYEAWMDHDIVPGDDYDSSIENAIRRSAIFVVVVTDATEHPDSFVRREIQYAHDLGKPIVPVRLSASQGPILLKRRQWLTATDALGPKMLECLHGSTRILSEPKNKGRTSRWTMSAFLMLVVVALSFAWAKLPTKMHEDGPLVPGTVPARSPDFQKEVVEHVELLETRGRVIEQHLADIDEDDAREAFLSLHQENLRALNQAKITLSHELTTQIRDVLEPFRYSRKTMYRPNFDDPNWKPPWHPKYNEPLKDTYLDFEDIKTSNEGDASEPVSTNSDQVPADTKPSW